VEARGGRFVDPEKEQFVETVDHADMLIADISSVLVDFLSVDRPALVTDVQGLGAIEMRRRYPSVAWAGVLAPDLGNLDEVVDEARRDDRRGDARAYFLGDIDDPVRRFHEVLQGLVQGTSP
jgi:CDP-glycerol glycerophosphotransferase (TagB/SpsB family)